MWLFKGVGLGVKIELDLKKGGKSIWFCPLKIRQREGEDASSMYPTASTYVFNVYSSRICFFVVCTTYIKNMF